MVSFEKLDPLLSRVSLDINLKTFPHGSGFCALASVSLADKPLGQYASGGAGGFGGGGGFGGSAFGTGGGFGDDAQYAGGAGGGEDNLEEVIPGIPGDDYPIFAEVPETSFFCDGQTDGGYYSDPEAECQAFHICAGDGTGGLTKYSFLCPNGTLLNQQYFVCDWWFNVDCSLAESLYALNDEIAAEREANSPAGGQGQYAGGQGGGAGGRQGGGSRGQSQYGNAGGAGGRSSGSSRGGSKGSRASASSSRNSYSAPSDSYSSAGSSASPTYSFPEEFGGNGFGPADSGYGAPSSSSAGAGYGAPSSGASLDTGYGAPGGAAAEGYGAPSYSGRTGRRRNTRQLVGEPELE